MTFVVHNCCVGFWAVFCLDQIKGLVDLDRDAPRKRPEPPDGCRDDPDRNGDRDHDPPSHQQSNPSSSMSPPHKRSRISPVDSLMLRDHDLPDPRELRLDPRGDFSRDSARGELARDLSRDSNRDSRDLNRDQTDSRCRDLSRGDSSRDHSREFNRDVKREIGRDMLQRELLSRDLPRDLSSQNFSTVGSNSTGVGWPTPSSTRRLTPSPVITSPSPINRSIAPYYSRTSQYDAPLPPPRSSPKSPIQENKLPSQLG